MTETLQRTTITIPVPLDRDLSPNARHGHWAIRNRAVVQARSATDYAMRADIDLNDPQACFQRARWPLTLDWEIGLAKRQRRLDDDNAIAACKPHRDQIAACLGIDDRNFVTGNVEQVRDPDGWGYIRVTITEAAS